MLAAVGIADHTTVNLRDQPFVLSLDRIDSLGELLLTRHHGFERDHGLFDERPVDREHGRRVPVPGLANQGFCVLRHVVGPA